MDTKTISIIAAIAVFAVTACDQKPTPASGTTEASTDSQTTESKAPVSLAEIRAARDRGDFSEALAGYRTLSNPKAAWIGQAEIASLQGDDSALEKLAKTLDSDALDDEWRRAAVLYLPPVKEPGSVQTAIVEAICNPGPGAIDPALSHACARHATAKGRDLTKCSAGCDTPHTIGLYPAGFPIVYASVNGSEPMPFGVFGVAPMILTPETVTKLGLERAGGSFHIESSGQPATANMVVADLSMGDVSWTDVPFVELELPEDFIVGGISPDTLFDRAVEFDLTSWELRVAPATPASDLATGPLIHIDDAWAAFGEVAGRATRPIAIDLGQRGLTVSDQYHAAGDPFEGAREQPATCAGGVECVRRMVMPFELPTMIAGVELDYPMAYVSPPEASSTANRLELAAFAGTGGLIGRTMRFDPARGEFGISRTSQMPELTAGDEASFEVSGKRVASPVMLTEKVLEAGDDFNQISQVFEGDDTFNVFQILVPEDSDARGGWLHTRPVTSAFALVQGGDRKQISVEDYHAAIRPHVVRFRAGPSIHMQAVDWSWGGEKFRCLEMRAQAQFGPEEFGLMEAVQCPSARWRVPLVNFISGDEVLFEMRRSGAKAGERALVR